MVSKKEIATTRRGIEEIKNSKLDHLLIHRFHEDGSEDVAAVIEGEPVKIGKTKRGSIGSFGRVNG